MKDQVIVALVDGMRPDGAFACGHPFFERLTRESFHCLDAQTITRPVTLPAHVSLFTGVDQYHHTVLDNIWHPYPEKYPGILESVHGAGMKTAMMITWDNLRFIGGPGSVDRFEYVRGDVPGRTEEAFMAFEQSWTRRALEIIRSEEYDFLFFYFEMADVVGHWTGWMGDQYLRALHCAGGCLERIFEALSPRQQLIVLSDHGGSGTGHSDPNSAADMTIPIWCAGSRFPKGVSARGWSILDIAPTVSDLLDIPAQAHYQGTSCLAERK